MNGFGESDYWDEYRKASFERDAWRNLAIQFGRGVDPAIYTAARMQREFERELKKVMETKPHG
jgi:hypothetical protein